VHLPGREPLVGAGVTLPARRSEVRLTDARGGVGRREGLVSAVARGAARGLEGPPAPRPARVAVGAALRPVLGHAVLLGEADRAVAGGADPRGHVRGGDGRARIAVLLDVVLTVAVRADGSVLAAARVGLAVSACAVVRGLLGMAFRAGLRDPVTAHLRSGVRAALHHVGSMAVHAVGGPRVAPEKGSAVNALLVRSDEPRARGHARAHVGIVQVAREAELLLLPLVARAVLGGACLGDRVLMTGRALRSAPDARRRGAALLGGGGLAHPVVVALLAAAPPPPLAVRDGEL